jgi:hypothetical protein
MRSGRVFVFASLLVVFSCASRLPSWVGGLSTRLRCGMSLDEVQALTPLRLNTLSGKRPWLGMYYFRKGGTDLWLQLEDGRLQSFIVSKVNGLATVRLSPKENLCTGKLAFRLRIYLPKELAGACVFLDEARLSCSEELLRDVEMPAGQHQIRITHDGYAPFSKRYSNQVGDRGDLELRVLPPS